MRSAPAAITRAFSFGQPCSGLTSRSRDSPKLAMARAAAPIFSPSCGSTRTMMGAGVSIQRFVLSVPAPGIAYRHIDRDCIMFAYAVSAIRSGAVEVAHVLKQFRRRYIYPWLKALYPYKQAAFKGIQVSYKDHLDGGGRGFGQDFIPLLQHFGLPRQARAFEWCSGPGFIGFSMLAHGLCETLCLADINPESVQACRRTIADNALSDRVAVYCSDNLQDIPAAEKWDLVVSNPPHF